MNIGTRAQGLVTSIVMVAVAALGVGGCSSYATPGRGADMTVFNAAQAATSDGTIRAAYAAEPLAEFPASVALVRVQASGYQNYAGNAGYGSGRYSVITKREVETDDELAKITALGGVKGLAAMNRLLIPVGGEGLTSDRELRAVAAGLRADLLLVYTFDTVFDSDQYAGAVSFVSLGMFPTQVENVRSNASAVLLDTRTGFVHAVAEGTGDAGQLANFWTSKDAADDARLRAEGRAFRGMVDSLVTEWPKVLAANAGRRATVSPAAAGMLK